MICSDLPNVLVYRSSDNIHPDVLFVQVNCRLIFRAVDLYLFVDLYLICRPVLVADDEKNISTITTLVSSPRESVTVLPAVCYHTNLHDWRVVTRKFQYSVNYSKTTAVTKPYAGC